MYRVLLYTIFAVAIANTALQQKRAPRIVFARACCALTCMYPPPDMPELAVLLLISCHPTLWPARRLYLVA